ncbi:MAG: sodium:proton exchanger, partial [Proteobacteria bacterium]|nr:sodium:proton exchanger [Pseudomonadota bacterium]
MLLRQTSPRPWAWPRQLGTASSLLTMLMFVLVSVVAAQAEWSRQVAGTVLALVAARLVAKFIGVALGNAGSGTSWKQALWVGCTMSPMSSIALLLTVEAVAASPERASMIAAIALPTILLMEMLGSVIATVAIHQAGESSQPWAPVLVRSVLGDGNES